MNPHLPHPSASPVDGNKSYTSREWFGWFRSIHDFVTSLMGVTTADHGKLEGRSDDDHTQYALLAGRAGGQTLIGGTVASNNLTLQSTSHATRGSVIVNDQIGIGGVTPVYPLQTRVATGRNLSMLDGNGIVANASMLYSSNDNATITRPMVIKAAGYYFTNDGSVNVDNLTASQRVETDGSKNLVSKANAAAQADSTAAALADLVTDFNALLAKLRTAGLMAP